MLFHAAHGFGKSFISSYDNATKIDPEKQPNADLFLTLLLLLCVSMPVLCSPCSHCPCRGGTTASTARINAQEHFQLTQFIVEGVWGALLLALEYRAYWVHLH